MQGNAHQGTSDKRIGRGSYAVACVIPVLMLVALAATAPDLAASYVAFILVLLALPIVFATIVGVLTDGDVIPNPFVLYPIASIVVATLAFLLLAVVAPGVMALAGGFAAGAVIAVVVVVIAIRMLGALLG